jgi:serine protease Do
MTSIATLAESLSRDSETLAAQLRAILVTVRSGAGGGSGTAWTTDGGIITNHHVVPEDEAVVTLDDGSEHRAVVEARDPEHDLALLRIDAALPIVAQEGDSAGVRPGALAFAIGNPWGQRGTVTSGAIFSTGGATEDNGVQLRGVIRADLRLAPGNSGGPMTDAAGRVIGINSMIAGGMAIAVPAHEVVEFVARAKPGARGVLGISFQPVRVPHAIAASYEVEDETGLMLTGIEPGSAAEQAGLLPGDIVLGAANGRRGLRHLARPFRSIRANEPMPLSLLRGGQLIEVTTHPAPSVS